MDSAKYNTTQENIYKYIYKKIIIRRKLCNKVKCALQYTVDLINNNINRDVQEECANRLGLVQNAIKYNKYLSVLKMKNGQKCPSLVCSTVNTMAYCQYYDPFHPVKTVSADSKSYCFQCF